ncbi:MAG: polymorphic toxin type 44 domain-containing protein, partial [Firmicutes bacterium]|nr:polymorphic toxin type 44 domain-containing protein [Bacillota bacterium]
NRMMNPRLGRWTQPDPFFHMRFGQARMMGSPNAIAQAGNLFLFTMNNPVRWIDPSGLFAVTAGTPGIPWAPRGSTSTTTAATTQTPSAVNPGYRVNFVDYLRAMGATVQHISPSNGQARVSVTVNGATTRWLLNSGYMLDTAINARFGFDSFLTDADRTAGVGIVITSGNLYRNVTAPVNAALAVTATQAAATSRFNLAWFYRQVNHDGPWDIKRELRWEETIGSTFPGRFDTPIYFRGYRMTPESLGNWTYGYIGAAQGIPLNVLRAGSWYAAGFPVGGDDWANERGDWVYIQRGFNTRRGR